MIRTWNSPPSNWVVEEGNEVHEDDTVRGLWGQLVVWGLCVYCGWSGPETVQHLSNWAVEEGNDEVHENDTVRGLWRQLVIWGLCVYCGWSGPETVQHLSNWAVEEADDDEGHDNTSNAANYDPISLNSIVRTYNQVINKCPLHSSSHPEYCSTWVTKEKILWYPLFFLKPDGLEMEVNTAGQNTSCHLTAKTTF